MLEDFGFVRHRQEDAHEFLRRLLDSVELNQGTLRSSLRCPKCHYSTENIEKFSDISLEPKRSLERSLSAFFSKEILDFQNMWQCSRCEEKVRAVKTLDIQQHPHTLVVHLKRYGRGRTGTKLARHVAFPHKLFLHSQLYNLRAILVHDGTTTRSGHYSAYVKDAEDSWYLFDDDTVAKVSPGHVFRQQAYILFYAKTQSKLLASTFHAQSPLKFFHKRNKRKKFQLAFIYPPPPIAPQTQETKTETNTFFDLKRDDEQQLDTTKYRYDYWDRALDAPRKSKRLKQG